MDKDVKKAIEDMLREYFVRPDNWIAKRVEGASPEMVRGIRLVMECRGKLPRLGHFVDSNGQIWPREFGSVAQCAA